MLDIKFIRDNLELVKLGAAKKHIVVDLDRLIAVDDTRRELMTAVETARAKQNEASAKIPSAAPAQKEAMLKEMKTLKEAMSAKEDELKEVMVEWQTLMVQVPNIPDVSVPEGESDTDNKEFKTWGDKTKFPFEAKSHIEIMEALGMADFERGAKVAGFRGYFLKGSGALLSLAILNYAQKFFLEKGFTPMIVPSLVRRVNFLGTGWLLTNLSNPKFLILLLAFFAQFITPSMPLWLKALYGYQFSIIALLWFSALAVMLTTQSVRSRITPFLHYVERITGIVLIVFAVLAFVVHN
jgi:seryl-tRNA synthetase